MARTIITTLAVLIFLSLAYYLVRDKEESACIAPAGYVCKPKHQYQSDLERARKEAADDAYALFDAAVSDAVSQPSTPDCFMGWTNKPGGL